MAERYDRDRCGIAQGLLEAARSAGAHDEYITFVAEYPDSTIAEGLRTAVALDSLDDAKSFMGSFEYALFSKGAQACSNADTENGELLRELFTDDQLPEVLRQ